jgi:tRNA (guanine37-N1)-methyltransferase
MLTGQPETEVTMNFHVITLFPEMIESLCGYGVLGRAIKQGDVSLRCWNPRDFTRDRHRTVDDRPYGGGPGMLMKVQPLVDTIAAVREVASADAMVVYLSPQGEVLKQSLLVDTAAQQRDLILIAGRYEGIDERIISQQIDAEWSIGDYVLSGGELAAAVIIGSAGFVHERPAGLSALYAARRDRRPACTGSITGR